MEQIKNYIETHKNRFISELVELLKIPSISADTAFSQDVLETAKVVEKALAEAGCDQTEIYDPQGYPVC